MQTAAPTSVPPGSGTSAYCWRVKTGRILRWMGWGIQAGVIVLLLVILIGCVWWFKRGPVGAMMMVLVLPAGLVMLGVLASWWIEAWPRRRVRVGGACWKCGYDRAGLA